MDPSSYSQRVDSRTPLIRKDVQIQEKIAQPSKRGFPKFTSKKLIAFLICVASAVIAISIVESRQQHRLGLNSCVETQKVTFLTQQSEGWTEAISPWNERMRFIPVAVTLPKSVDQIQAVFTCAIDHKVPVSVKGGGHSFGSYGLGGEDGHLVIDLQQMHQVTLHGNHTASIQPGARLGHVSVELYHQGRRALPHGACPGVGIAGHVLSGGYGRAARSHGLTLDWLVGAQVLLANGSLVHCSATENEDLFWALRGAGASFGIVTSFEFNTFEVPDTVVPFTIELPFSKEKVAAALSAVQDFAFKAPRELNFFLFVSTTSQVIQGLYLGTEDDLKEVLQPLLDRLETKISSIFPGNWLQGLEAYADGLYLDQTIPYSEHATYYTSSLVMPPMTNKQLESLTSTMFANIDNSSARHTWDIFFEMHGGPVSAVSQVNTSATAYPHRDKVLLWQLSDVEEKGDYPTEGFDVLKQLMDSVTQFMADGAWGMYANFLDTQLNARSAQKLYYGSNLPRLKAIKSKVDPSNVFWNPQGISTSF